MMEKYVVLCNLDYLWRIYISENQNENVWKWKCLKTKMKMFENENENVNKPNETLIQCNKCKH